jgi:hypothetical protein
MAWLASITTTLCAINRLILTMPMIDIVIGTYGSSLLLQTERAGDLLHDGFCGMPSWLVSLLTLFARTYAHFLFVQVTESSYTHVAYRPFLVMVANAKYDMI